MAVEPKRHGGASAADKAVEQIIERIHEARQFDFRNYKRPTLRRRIERRMADRRCRSAVDYLALIEREPAELQAAIPVLDGGSALGSVITFEDVTRMANLSAEIATLKAGETSHGKRARR
jgi:hypothetical protein